jgi:hypothetical protein
MKTYTVELSAEKALPILQGERRELVERLAVIDKNIMIISADLGISVNGSSNGNGSDRRSTLLEQARRLAQLTSAEIEKTPAGRSVKGQTEDSIANFLNNAPLVPLSTQAIANAVGANYHTALRALKNLQVAGMVITRDDEWKKTERLLTMATP